MEDPGRVVASGAANEDSSAESPSTEQPTEERRGTEKRIVGPSSSPARPNRNVASKTASETVRTKRAGRLPDPPRNRMASPPNTIADRHLAAQRGNVAGKKTDPTITVPQARRLIAPHLEHQLPPATQEPTQNLSRTVEVEPQNTELSGNSPPTQTAVRHVRQTSPVLRMENLGPFR